MQHPGLIRVGRQFAERHPPRGQINDEEEIDGQQALPTPHLDRKEVADRKASPMGLEKSRPGNSPTAVTIHTASDAGES